MKNQFIFSRRLFCSIPMFFFFLLSSESVLAREISYRTRDSWLAHKLIGDGGKLYNIPIVDAEHYLPTHFKIHRSSVKVVDRRIFPGKDIIYLMRSMVYYNDSGVLHGRPSELFGSLNEGIVHTFVVTSDKLIFVESTKNPQTERTKDKLSKHYVISGLKNKVRYSGEFFVYYHPAKKHVHVVFDNSSGTYRPDSNALPQLKLLIDANLSDENITFHVKSFDQEIDVYKMFAGDKNCFL